MATILFYALLTLIFFCFYSQPLVTEQMHTGQILTQSKANKNKSQHEQKPTLAKAHTDENPQQKSI